MRLQFWISCAAALLAMASAPPTSKKPVMSKPAVKRLAPSWLLPFRLESASSKAPSKVGKPSPAGDRTSER